MTEITQQKIFEKIQLLEEYINYLEKLSDETKEDKDKFLNDFHLFGATERYFQLAIQCLIDIVQLIIIELKLNKPDNSQEAISILFNKKIISENLASRLDGIVGFRNILVHEYSEIDKEKIYNYLQNRIQDFRIFHKEILKWLNSISNFDKGRFKLNK